MDFGLEYEFVIVECELGKMGSTLAMPLEPQSPTASKACLIGRRITSLLSESSIWFMDLSQVW